MLSYSEQPLSASIPWSSDAANKNCSRHATNNNNNALSKIFWIVRRVCSDCSFYYQTTSLALKLVEVFLPHADVFPCGEVGSLEQFSHGDALVKGRDLFSYRTVKFEFVGQYLFNFLLV